MLESISTMQMLTGKRIWATILGSISGLMIYLL